MQRGFTNTGRVLRGLQAVPLERDPDDWMAVGSGEVVPVWGVPGAAGPGQLAVITADCVLWTKPQPHG